MSSMKWLMAACVGWVLMGTLAAQDESWNVLLFIDDQHNPRMLGTDSNGFGGLSRSLTPELDSLASAGIRFSRAYCSAPQCMPARFSMLTGRYPHHHGLRWNKIWEPRGGFSIARLAREFGYVTATIGKHHFNWLDQAEPLVEDHGFDEILGLEDYDDHCAAQGVPSWKATGNFWTIPNLPPGLAPAGYTFNLNSDTPPGYFADQAIEFLRRRAGPAGDDRPFLLWCSFYGPHTPILPSGPADPSDWAHKHHPWQGLSLPPNMGKVADTDRLAKAQGDFSQMSVDQHREALSYYYGLVSQVDHNIGRVLDELDLLQLNERTLVVFISDHGEAAGEMSFWTKGGGAYESLTRIPLCMRLPAVIPAGRESNALVSTVDLVPTLVEVLGLTPPADALAGFDGSSLLAPARAARTPSDWRQEVFTELGHPGLDLIQRHRAVITANRKYNFDELGGGQEELFDLSLDPWEMTNLVADPTYQSDLALLRGALDEWFGDESTHAPLYTVAGPSNSPPARATEFVPARDEKDVQRDIDLGWLPSTACESQSVWMGTDPSALVLVGDLGPMESSFNPGTLDPATTYYWRVDGHNAHGTRPGLLLLFETLSVGPGGPPLAENPVPASGAVDVAMPVVLRWTAPAGATLQDLWFGLEGEPLQLAGSQLPGTQQSFDPGPLSAGSAYRWRVDGVDPQGTTEGTAWTFRVSSAGLPLRATGPRPAHLDMQATHGPGMAVHWSPAAGATAYDVYFGKSYPPPYRGRVTGTSYMPGPVHRGRVYYWRVDSINPRGKRVGFTWSFGARKP